jgi:hypothetical protein
MRKKLVCRQELLLNSNKVGFLAVRPEMLRKSDQNFPKSPILSPTLGRKICPVISQKAMEI